MAKRVKKGFIFRVKFCWTWESDLCVFYAFDLQKFKYPCFTIWVICQEFKLKIILILSYFINLFEHKKNVQKPTLTKMVKKDFIFRVNNQVLLDLRIRLMCLLFLWSANIQVPTLPNELSVKTLNLKSFLFCHISLTFLRIRKMFKNLL